MTEENALPKEKAGAESPTTARPIDFDDDQQETGIIHPEPQSAPADPSIASPQHRVRFEQADDDEDTPAPTKPPRPMSPRQQAESTLIEAFPDTDAKIVKAVLSASGGDLERAFEALLEMTDPTYQSEAPPPQPPRPTAQQRQLEQDEMYARQLAQHYEGRSAGGYGARSSSLPQGRQPVPPANAAEQQKEYSFFDDELPEIGENLRQGFMQTQTKLSKWISDFRKRIDGEEDDDPLMAHGSSSQAQYQGAPAQYPQNNPSEQNPQAPATYRSSATYWSPDATRTRRSTDRERYDDDPQVLSSNFTELELRDEESEAPPQKPPRPQANPNLFKSSAGAAPSGPVDEIDVLDGRPSPAEPAGGRSKKWQPLTSVAPNPDAEDNDPFSLGDSDEERESKLKDVRAEDTERLKSLAESTPATQEGDATEGSKTLEAAERSGSQGTRNKEMEDLMHK